MEKSKHKLKKELKRAERHKEWLRKNLPNTKMEKNNQKEILKLDKDKPIAVYCAVGGRSSSTAQFLRQQGFKKVYDLKGGMFAWSRKGFKIIK